MVKRFLDLQYPGVFILVLMCQLTDVGFYGIKAGEMIVLLAFPFVLLNIGAIKNSKIMVFIYLFIFLFVCTLIKNPIVDFYPPAAVDNFFKESYVISLIRFIELLLCAVAFVYVYILCSKLKNAHDILNVFLMQNAAFGLFFIAALVLAYAGADLDLTYGKSHRLKGFFVEGGPLGVFYASLLCVDLVANRKVTISSIIFFIVILAAQSKAAIFLLVIYFFIYALFSEQSMKKKLISILFSCLIAAVGYVFYGDLVMGYIMDSMNIQQSLIGREDDPNIVMGRISGAFIGYNIILDNPIFGVGLGNYSLVRNNPDYLGFFPVVDQWDLTGLGMYTIQVENGLLGILAFTFAFRCFYKRLIYSIPKSISLIPIICIFFGTQFYFLYIWVILGFAIGISRFCAKEKDAAIG